ncbi:uncharacterized protein LOC143909607 isoform X2 [Arctopsyche grandis]
MGEDDAHHYANYHNPYCENNNYNPRFNYYGDRPPQPQYAHPLLRESLLYRWPLLPFYSQPPFRYYPPTSHQPNYPFHRGQSAPRIFQHRANYRNPVYNNIPNYYNPSAQFEDQRAQGIPQKRKYPVCHNHPHAPEIIIVDETSAQILNDTNYSTQNQPVQAHSGIDLNHMARQKKDKNGASLPKQRKTVKPPVKKNSCPPLNPHGSKTSAQNIAHEVTQQHPLPAANVYSFASPPGRTHCGLGQPLQNTDKYCPHHSTQVAPATNDNVFTSPPRNTNRDGLSQPMQKAFAKAPLNHPIPVVEIINVDTPPPNTDHGGLGQQHLSSQVRTGMNNSSQTTLDIFRDANRHRQLRISTDVPVDNNNVNPLTSSSTENLNILSQPTQNAFGNTPQHCQIPIFPNVNPLISPSRKNQNILCQPPQNMLGDTPQHRQMPMFPNVNPLTSLSIKNQNILSQPTQNAFGNTPQHCQMPMFPNVNPLTSPTIENQISMSQQTQNTLSDTSQNRQIPIVNPLISLSRINRNSLSQTTQNTLRDTPQHHQMPMFPNVNPLTSPTIENKNSLSRQTQNTLGDTPQHCKLRFVRIDNKTNPFNKTSVLSKCHPTRVSPIIEENTSRNMKQHSENEVNKSQQHSSNENNNAHLLKSSQKINQVSLNQPIENLTAEAPQPRIIHISPNCSDSYLFVSPPRGNQDEFVQPVQNIAADSQQLHPTYAKKDNRVSNQATLNVIDETPPHHPSPIVDKTDDNINTLNRNSLIQPNPKMVVTSQNKAPTAKNRYSDTSNNDQCALDLSETRRKSSTADLVQLTQKTIDETLQDQPREISRIVNNYALKSPPEKIQNALSHQTQNVIVETPQRHSSQIPKKRTFKFRVPSNSLNQTDVDDNMFLSLTKKNRYGLSLSRPNLTVEYHPTRIADSNALSHQDDSKKSSMHVTIETLPDNRKPDDNNPEHMCRPLKKNISDLSVSKQYMNNQPVKLHSTAGDDEIYACTLSKNNLNNFSQSKPNVFQEIVHYDSPETDIGYSSPNKNQVASNQVTQNTITENPQHSSQKSIIANNYTIRSSSLPKENQESCVKQTVICENPMLKLSRISPIACPSNMVLIENQKMNEQNNSSAKEVDKLTSSQNLEDFSHSNQIVPTEDEEINSVHSTGNEIDLLASSNENIEDFSQLTVDEQEVEEQPDFSLEDVEMDLVKSPLNENIQDFSHQKKNEYQEVHESCNSPEEDGTINLITSLSNENLEDHLMENDQEMEDQDDFITEEIEMQLLASPLNENLENVSPPLEIEYQEVHERCNSPAKDSENNLSPSNLEDTKMEIEDQEMEIEGHQMEIEDQEITERNSPVKGYEMNSLLSSPKESLEDFSYPKKNEGQDTSVQSDSLAEYNEMNLLPLSSKESLEDSNPPKQEIITTQQIFEQHMEDNVNALSSPKEKSEDSLLNQDVIVNIQEVHSYTCFGKENNMNLLISALQADLDNLEAMRAQPERLDSSIAAKDKHMNELPSSPKENQDDLCESTENIISKSQQNLIVSPAKDDNMNVLTSSPNSSVPDQDDLNQMNQEEVTESHSPHSSSNSDANNVNTSSPEQNNDDISTSQQDVCDNLPGTSRTIDNDTSSDDISQSEPQIETTSTSKGFSKKIPNVMCRLRIEPTMLERILRRSKKQRIKNIPLNDNAFNWPYSELVSISDAARAKGPYYLLYQNLELFRQFFKQFNSVAVDENPYDTMDVEEVEDEKPKINILDTLTLCAHSQIQNASFNLTGDVDNNLKLERDIFDDDDTKMDVDDNSNNEHHLVSDSVMANKSADTEPQDHLQNVLSDLINDDSDLSLRKKVDNFVAKVNNITNEDDSNLNSETDLVETNTLTDVNTDVNIDVNTDIAATSAEEDDGLDQQLGNIHSVYDFDQPEPVATTSIAKKQPVNVKITDNLLEILEGKQKEKSKVKGKNNEKGECSKSSHKKKYTCRCGRVFKRKSLIAKHAKNDCSIDSDSSEKDSTTKTVSVSVTKKDQALANKSLKMLFRLESPKNSKGTSKRFVVTSKASPTPEAPKFHKMCDKCGEGHPDEFSFVMHMAGHDRVAKKSKKSIQRSNSSK